MRIAQVAPPLESVPPVGYGGTERVIATLTEELVRRGHDVTLFAPGDSRSSAALVPTVERALWHLEDPPDDFTPSYVLTAGETLQRIDDFDIVHSHIDMHGLPLAMADRRPVVTTLHDRLDSPWLVPLYRTFSDAPLVSISNAQREPLPFANWAATVYHGIELDSFEFHPDAGEYLAFLGRISPDKGLDTAIQIARRAGVPLKIAARPPLSDPALPDARVEREFYDERIEPLLSEPGVEMVGEIEGEEKAQFLGHAAALLFPIRWPEPFGLVMVEALATGTPVLALRAGSVPEVIDDGVTGFIRDAEDELVSAVASIGSIDRRTCRATVERRFSPAAMAEAYEDVYSSLQRGSHGV